MAARPQSRKNPGSGFLILSLALFFLLIAREAGISKGGVPNPDVAISPGVFETQKFQQKKPPAGQKAEPREKNTIRSRAASPYRRGVDATRQTWARTYSRAGTMNISNIGVIYGYRMSPAVDGGLFLLGHTSAQIPASYDSCIMKVGAEGLIEWQRVYRYDGVTQFIRSVHPTSDGGCIAGGEGGSGLVAIKFLPSGDIEWQRLYDQAGKREYFADLQQTSDGGYLLLGSSGDPGTTGWPKERDILLVKLDSRGNPVWQRTYGGPLDEGAFGFLQMPDGGYLICGSFSEVFDYVSPRNLLLLRLSSSGDIEWQTAYEGSGIGIFSFKPTGDGGSILVGIAHDNGSQLSYDPWTIKVTSGGAVEWKKNYHGRYDEQFRSIQQTPDGGYIVAGNTNSFSSPDEGGRALLAKLAPDGEIEWQRTYGNEGVQGRWSDASCVFSAPDGGYYFGGTTTISGLGGLRFLLVKASSEGLIERLPGFVETAGLEVQVSSAEPVSLSLVAQETTVAAQAFKLTRLDVAIKGGLLFSPPVNLAATTLKTRSLALVDYTNELTWEPNSANDDLNIVKYSIYSLGPLPPDVWITSEISERLEDVGGYIFRYYHHHVQGSGSYLYQIWGVTADGGEGIAVDFVYKPTAGRGS